MANHFLELNVGGTARAFDRAAYQRGVIDSAVDASLGTDCVENRLPSAATGLALMNNRISLATSGLYTGFRSCFGGLSSSQPEAVHVAKNACPAENKPDTMPWSPGAISLLFRRSQRRALKAPTVMPMSYT
jgi:hypothetical protein